MNQPLNHTLSELLGRTWHLPAPVQSLVFSSDGATVAFAGADGRVALAPVSDPEPPDIRIRVSGDLGQTTIRPRERAPAPLTCTGPLGRGEPMLARHGRSDFLVGADDGVLSIVSAAGGVEPTGIAFDGPIVALDHAPGSGLTAASDGLHLVILHETRSLARRSCGDTERITALAWGPDGQDLAAAQGPSLVLERHGPSPDTRAIGNAWPDSPGRLGMLRWRPDGTALAAGRAEGGIAWIDLEAGRHAVVDGFPAPVRSLDWSGPAKALLTAGAYRITGWSTETPPFENAQTGALVTGRAGLVLVDRVAAHPRRPLLAAGYGNGQIVVAEVGRRDELLVRPAGGAITALAWSPDGSHLAVGDQDGTASLITFPRQVFK